jgi:hypothetical protein
MGRAHYNLGGDTIDVRTFISNDTVGFASDGAITDNGNDLTDEYLGDCPACHVLSYRMRILIYRQAPKHDLTDYLFFPLASHAPIVGARYPPG